MALVIAERRIGGQSPCFVIAEAGVNHNGDPALAHRLVDAAADAGADAVKFQTFDADCLASERAPTAEYQKRSTRPGETQRQMLRDLTLSRDAHAALKRHSEERGLIFMSTPFDEGSADFLDDLGVSAFKMASGELTNHAFLAHVAAKRKPMLVSTGMSDLDEVAAAVEVLGSTPFILMHCTSSYPAPPEAANLRVLATLARHFSVDVGYSDHTRGDETAIAAVALGACVVEKHLTLDRTLPGPDHGASSEPGELTTLISRLRVAASALGDGIKRAQPCELEVRRVARRSLFASRNLRAGELLTPKDLVARRPGDGVSPARLAGLIGKRLRRDLASGAMLAEEDVE